MVSHVVLGLAPLSVAVAPGPVPFRFRTEEFRRGTFRHGTRDATMPASAIEVVSRAMSLASFAVLMIIAIRMSDDRDDLRGITHVQWTTGYAGSEESSVQDLIHWLTTRAGRAYVRLPDGTRGPRVQVAGTGRQLYLRSHPDDESWDPLLSLPRLTSPGSAHRRPSHRRNGRRTAAGR